jgi:hypothetical protein
VEAAAIFGMIVTIVFSMIVFGFQVYHKYTEEISSYEVTETNPVERFRLIAYGKDVLEEVLKK